MVGRRKKCVSAVTLTYYCPPTTVTNVAMNYLALRLLQGYERYGVSSNKWRKIQMDPDFGDIVSLLLSISVSAASPVWLCTSHMTSQLRRRSNGDLKDKYRNIQLSMSKSGDRIARREKGDTLWTEEEKQAYVTSQSYNHINRVIRFSIFRLNCV